MTSAFALQFTSVRIRVVDGETLIGLKHTAKDAEGARVSTDWVEMPPEDVERLVKTPQVALAELGRKYPAPRRSSHLRVVFLRLHAAAPSTTRNV